MSVHTQSPVAAHQSSRLYAPNPTPASPTPRRHSQQMPSQQLSVGEHIPRPPSRSERLLRDTLMRDELERHVPSLPAPPIQYHPPARQVQAQAPRPTHRSSRSYSISSSHTHRSQSRGSPQSDEDEPSFLFRPQAHATRAPLVRNKSTGHVRQSNPTASYRQARESDRSQRPSQRHASPSPSRRPLQRAHNSMPTSIPLSPASPTSSSSRSRSQSASGGGCALTPHEAVLRSRLEKVLSMGREEQEREHSRSKAEEAGWYTHDVSSPIHSIYLGFHIDYMRLLVDIIPVIFWFRRMLRFCIPQFWIRITDTLTFTFSYLSPFPTSKTHISPSYTLAPLLAPQKTRRPTHTP